MPFLTCPDTKEKVARVKLSIFFSFSFFFTSVIVSDIARWCNVAMATLKVSYRGFERLLRGNENVGKMKVYKPRHFCSLKAKVS